METVPLAFAPGIKDSMGTVIVATTTASSGTTGEATGFKPIVNDQADEATFPAASEISTDAVWVPIGRISAAVSGGRKTALSESIFVGPTGRPSREMVAFTGGFSVTKETQRSGKRLPASPWGP